MGYCFVWGACVNCHAPIAYNPIRVPSLTVNGHKEPLCEACFNKWNEIHRTSKGLAPLPLNPDAYKPCNEADL